MRHPIPATATLLCATFLLAACDSSPASPAPEGPDAVLWSMADHGAHVSARPPAGSHAADMKALADVRAGTARYHDFDRAVDEGWFLQLSPCVASPMGGMGFHYGNPARLADPTVDPGNPEILLYEPMSNGRMRLVGVEYVIEAGAWYGAGNDAPPSLAGRAFDPPNPNHPDAALQTSYTLHVWAWRENPDGMFAPFNPKVSCG